MTNKEKIKVYYNSACPVCNYGINKQKGRMDTCEVDWHDVHNDVESHKDISSDLEFVRERLHVIDENNEVKIGIEAFITIWKHSPGEHWKATIISLPVIKQLATVSYNVFARILYIWNRSLGHW
jgi:predicted DCC family thiol-disulfide oxidoreductase YuxK